MKSWQVLLDFANELLTQDTSLNFSQTSRKPMVASGLISVGNE